MKKVKRRTPDELRAEYKRSDFGELVRGKYAERLPAMNTLIYKRTHIGDPNHQGAFGCHDCMGRVRRWDFDAVIGVGGKSPWRRDKDIAFKINWIGIDPRKTNLDDPKGPLVTFECFRLWDETGPDLRKVAPKLYRYMFEDQHVRFVMSKSLSAGMRKEVEAILNLLETHQPTNPGGSGKKISAKRKC